MFIADGSYTKHFCTYSAVAFFTITLNTLCVVLFAFQALLVSPLHILSKDCMNLTAVSLPPVLMGPFILGTVFSAQSKPCYNSH